MFSSNTEMAKHYLKECLADGKEHSREELLIYVLIQTNGAGIYGEQLSESIIGSALWTMTNIEKLCAKTRRGIYTTTGVNIESGTAAIFHRVSKIANKAINDINGCFVVDVGKLDISDDELLIAQEYGEKMRTLFQEIGQLSEEAINQIDELNAAADNSIQFV